MPFVYNEKMELYCSLCESKRVYALVCWGVHSCAQYFQSIRSSEGSPRKLLHYVCILVETDRDWYFSTSCDLFIEMKRRFAFERGASPHHRIRAIWSLLECLRHTSSFSSSIFRLSLFLIWCLSDWASFPPVKLKFYFRFCRFDQHAVMTQLTPWKTENLISSPVCVS